MNDDKESSSSIFSFLQSQAPAPQKLTVRNTDLRTPLGPIAHAVDGSGHPTLLVPVAVRAENVIDWQNKLVSFGYRTFTVAGKSQSFLALQCLAERVRPQFSLMADDILDAVAADPDRAELSTRQTVERWKELLRDDRARLLSQSQLSGLYGELLFLEQLAFHHGKWVLRSWTGPQGNRHDFEFQSASFEVKTTLNNNNMTVAFHGARQLEATNGRPLFVAAYQIESTPQGESIPSLLERLFAFGIDRLDMLRMLEKVGYYESDAGHYAAWHFSVLDTKIVAVDDDFPRITYDTFPVAGMLDRILALQYSVDLGPLDAIEVALEELAEATAL